MDDGPRTYTVFIRVWGISDESYFGRPVVPLLKSIHKGASKGRGDHLISPDDVRPSSAVRPSVTKASQLIQSLFHSVFFVVRGIAWMMMTLEG